MINPPKPTEGPKPTKAEFTRFFVDQSPVPKHKPISPPPKASSPPAPSTINSILAMAGSQEPLLMDQSC